MVDLTISVIVIGPDDFHQFGQCALVFWVDLREGHSVYRSSVDQALQPGLLLNYEKKGTLSYSANAGRKTTIWKTTLTLQCILSKNSNLKANVENLQFSKENSTQGSVVT